ncbi:MAG: hypothetical protein IIB71_17105 [Proteobacteria bacterium]|nr:hypothetical protein [Pseudomonadota bacterium]
MIALNMVPLYHKPTVRVHPHDRLDRAGGEGVPGGVAEVLEEEDGEGAGLGRAYLNPRHVHRIFNEPDASVPTVALALELIGRGR